MTPEDAIDPDDTLPTGIDCPVCARARMTVEQLADGARGELCFLCSGIGCLSDGRLREWRERREPRTREEWERAGARCDP